MNFSKARTLARRSWIWVAVLTALVSVWPFEYRITRVAFAMGLVTTWLGAIVFWWSRRGMRWVLILVGAIPVLALCLPGRDPDPDVLASDYVRALRSFRGVRYIWGGESHLGIDCSGLVRKGLMWGQLWHGLRTFNGRPVRDAAALWWHDASALALRDGYRGWTAELFRHKNVATADHALLRPGDLAITSDGIHVMAYLGHLTWIEADPKASKVLEIVLPSNSEWCWTAAVFVRWKWLTPPVSPGPSRRANSHTDSPSRLGSSQPTPDPLPAPTAAGGR